MRPEVVLAPSENTRQIARWEFSSAGKSGEFGYSPFGATSNSNACATISTGQPLLFGPVAERLSLSDLHAQRLGPVTYFEDEAFLLGFARLKADTASIEEQTRILYRTVLPLAKNKAFCRFWNYVPDINRVEAPYLENYKLFCSGRAEAFAEVHGENHPEFFPAASATGTGDGHLTVVFLASSHPVQNWENPSQTPAYEYPSRYGPRSPSFARASQFTDKGGREWTFISGTAAIKGHETQHPGNFQAQLEVTLGNLDITLRHVGLELEQKGSRRPRHFKAFLRRTSDLEMLKERLGRVLGEGDSLSIVEGEICRRDLEVEIEITVYPETGDLS